MINERVKPVVRIGMVDYINTAPLYEPWKRREQIEGWVVHEAPPAVLNQMLAAGELDLGFVSSFEYAKNPEKYRILPDLSISANGPVGSVFLFARKSIDDLENKPVLLSNQSETSAYLTRVVLEAFYGITPEYMVGDIRTDCLDECQGVLAIGDDALRLAENQQYDCTLDLGEIWKERTGLPFVYAICAVREEFCRNNRSLLQAVYTRLLECRVEGERNLQAICRVAAPRIPMDVDQCHAYLQGIEYDLGDEKICALKKYFSFLIERGDVRPEALPLRMHNFAP